MSALTREGDRDCNESDDNDGQQEAKNCENEWLTEPCLPASGIIGMKRFRVERTPPVELLRLVLLSPSLQQSVMVLVFPR